MTCLFLSCSVSTSARTDLLARVTLALRLTLVVRALPASGSFSVLESSKLMRLALLLTQKISTVYSLHPPSLPPYLVALPRPLPRPPLLLARGVLSMMMLLSVLLSSASRLASRLGLGSPGDVTVISTFFCSSLLVSRYSAITCREILRINSKNFLSFAFVFKFYVKNTPLLKTTNFMNNKELQTNLVTGNL